MKMFDPPHPGLVLAESFNENFTIEDAAHKMRVSVQTLTDITEGKAPITGEIAFLITAIFPHANPATWIGMQADYDSWQATHNRQWQKQMCQKHNLGPNFLDGFIKAQPSM